MAPDPINDGPTYIEDPKIINIRPTPTPNATGTIIKVIKIKR